MMTRSNEDHGRPNDGRDSLNDSPDNMNPFASPLSVSDELANGGVRDAKAEAYDKLKLPGILLLFFATFSFLAITAYLLLACWHMYFELPLRRWPRGSIALLAAVLATCVCHFFIAYSAFQMLYLRKYRMAWFACLLCCVPFLSPGFFFGMPFGIWGLAILRRKDVRDQFETNHV